MKKITALIIGILILTFAVGCSKASVNPIIGLNPAIIVAPTNTEINSDNKTSPVTNDKTIAIIGGIIDNHPNSMLNPPLYF